MRPASLPRAPGPGAQQAPPLARPRPRLGPPPPPAVPGGSINAEPGPGRRRSRKGQAEHGRCRVAAPPTAPSPPARPLFSLKERLRKKDERKRDAPARGPQLTTSNPLTH